MRLIQSVPELQHWRRTVAAELDHAPGSLPLIGLVPTMGALHRGHVSLIEQCRRDCDVTVVSVFVNPLQFGPHEDLDHYPRMLEADSLLCGELGVDVVFAPDRLLPDPSRDPVHVLPPPDLERRLCGGFRPGHFAGVLTVVAQLLHLVQPQRAYFGCKDYQQLVLIRGMAQDLWFPTHIIGCPTVRDPDGLALSSRNRYLSPYQRTQALALNQALQAAADYYFEVKRGAQDPCDNEILRVARAVLEQHPEIRIQYLEWVDPESLAPLAGIPDAAVLAVAAYVGKTRLIDNIMLHAAMAPDLKLDSPFNSQPQRRPLIAIDGPAGAGKSTVARRVAAQLGLLYLDTGAMYRALTWLALDKGIPLDSPEPLTLLAQQAQIELETQIAAQPGDPQRVWVDGSEVTRVIRSPQVTQAVSRISAHAGVRQAMVQIQRGLGKEGGAVLEGRDIGTTVFPDAELKIFLTASPGQRARRRQRELEAQGVQVDLDDLQEQIQARDDQDSQRPVAPLRQAADAVVINSDGLTVEQVQQQIVDLYLELSQT